MSGARTESDRVGHWIRASLYGSASTSWQALAWFAPLGVLAVMLTVPTDGGRAVSDPIWWSIAVAGQVVLSVIVLGLAWLVRGIESGWARVAILAFAGAARGAFISLAIDSADLTTATAASPVLRALNSAVVCALALGAIGLLLQGTADYRESYRLLLDQAVSVRRSALADSGAMDPEVLAHWEQARSVVRSATSGARARLAPEDVPPEDLAAAAAVIADAVSTRVRPMSHGLWFGSSDAPPRLRLMSLIRACLAPWRPPIGDTMAILAVISLIGSVQRAGVTVGLIFSALSLLLVWVILVLSHRLAHRHPHLPIGVATLIAMPVIVFAASVALGQGVFRLPPDLTGAAFGSLTASIVLLGVLVLRRMHLERGLLLDTMIGQIDDEFVNARARRRQVEDYDAAIGEYLHHAVQSELAAVALQLGEAARSADEATRRTRQADARRRLEQLDSLAPPWQTPVTPYAHIDEIAMSWRGMAEVQVDLPDESAARPEQWRLASLAIEEAVANAVRGGGARQITVLGRSEGDALHITITDDGRWEGAAGAGLGTAWLDRHLPGTWARDSDATGTRLTLRIP